MQANDQGKDKSDKKGVKDDYLIIDDENEDIDRKTILALCAYMFHPNRFNLKIKDEQLLSKMSELNMSSK